MDSSAVDTDIIDASSAFCNVNTILLQKPLLSVQLKPLSFSRILLYGYTASENGYVSEIAVSYKD